ncbi:MAG: hypothetical protein ACRERD_15425 [Candidatus Binatia bacterium]
MKDAQSYDALPWEVRIERDLQQRDGAVYTFLVLQCGEIRS